MSELPEHVARNRAHWDDLAWQYIKAGERAWAQEEPTWGIWQVPEAEVQIFSEELADKDAIELGCGTAHISAWLSRRGARVIGIDNSEVQLGTARRLQGQYGIDFPLIHGDAEAIAYPDASFDFAISEYAACLWADPQRWVPKAARLLRPGGQLVFLTNSFLMMLCMPPEDGVAATERLLRLAFGIRRVEWPESPGVEFHLSHGDWIRLLRRSGFEIEDLIEVRPAVGATSRCPCVTFEWARNWPCEEVWKTRKTDLNVGSCQLS
jgi:SAM-dependent methyltransferase